MLNYPIKGKLLGLTCTWRAACRVAVEALVETVFKMKITHRGHEDARFSASPFDRVNSLRWISLRLP